MEGWSKRPDTELNQEQVVKHLSIKLIYNLYNIIPMAVTNNLKLKNIDKNQYF